MKAARPFVAMVFVLPGCAEPLGVTAPQDKVEFARQAKLLATEGRRILEVLGK